MRIAVTALAAIAFAQGPSPVPHGTKVRPKAADYPVHATLAQVAIGAEYMVRSFGEPGQLFIADEYLVVEVALFPANRQEFPVDLRNFNLRLNGRDVLAAQTPGMVAASLKYPDWSMRPQTTAQAGPIILGRPQTQPRFPGDNRPSRERLPEVGHTQTTTPSDRDPSAIAITTALPEGRVRFPVSGFVYFPHRGKLNKLKSVELLAGDAVLPLR